MKKYNLNGDGHKIVKNGFSSVLQVIVASISYVIIYSLVIFQLGRVQLGTWSIITAIPAVIAFLGSGVSGSLVRYIPTYVARKEKENINKIIYNGLIFNLALGLFLVLIAFIFATDILKFMFSSKIIPILYEKLFRCAILTFLINFLSSVLLGALDGLQLFVLKNKIIICCTISFCLIASLLLFNLGLIGLLYAQLIQAVAVFIATLFALYKGQFFKWKFNKIDRDFLRLFYSYGSKLQYISVLNILFEPATKFFLNKYFNLGVVGTYDLVNRIVLQLRTLIVTAIQVIVPVVAEKTEKDEIVSNIYTKSSTGALLLSSILFGGLISSGFSLVYLFKKIEIAEFQIILVYLTIGYLVNIWASPAYAIRLARGELRYLIRTQLLSTGLNILLFLLLAQYPNPLLMLFPTCLAVGISSAYIILSYKPTFDCLTTIIDKRDKYIYVTSILLPAICILISKFYFNLPLLLIVCCLHALMMIFLVYKNEYLRNVIYILVKKGNKIPDG